MKKITLNMFHDELSIIKEKHVMKISIGNATSEISYSSAKELVNTLNQYIEEYEQEAKEVSNERP